MHSMEPRSTARDDDDDHQRRSYSEMLTQTSDFDRVVAKWKHRRCLLATSMDVAPFDRSADGTLLEAIEHASHSRRVDSNSTPSASVTSGGTRLAPLSPSNLRSESASGGTLITINPGFGSPVTTPSSPVRPERQNQAVLASPASSISPTHKAMPVCFGDLMSRPDNSLHQDHQAVSTPSPTTQSPKSRGKQAVTFLTAINQEPVTVEPSNVALAEAPGSSGGIVDSRRSHPQQNIGVPSPARYNASPNVLHALNRCRPRTLLSETLAWAIHYTDERRAFERLTDVEMDQVVAEESRPLWEPPEVVDFRPLPVRPGDTIAQRVQDSKRDIKNRFLTKVRQYMAYVETMVETETEESKKVHEQQAAERARQAEWSKSHPFEMGGVLDATFGNIAEVGEAKFSSLATRYYTIAYRHRQRDIDLREQHIIKLEHTTFKLGTVMSYDEFVVCFRQFHRYAAPNPFLIIARIPKQGWMFVDKVIKTLITRKIDKNKTGKIQFPDLLKHLFPAMSIEEINEVVPVFEKQYLEFSDKTVRLFTDTIDVDKVNHFGVVFSIVDKQGNGIVTREEFVQNMPFEKDDDVEEEEVRRFLGELFDANARRDMNAKLESIGEPYLDLDNMSQALSISRYNAYGGTIMSH